MGLIEQLKATPRWQERRELVRCSTDAAALLAWIPQEKEGWVRAAMAKVFGQLGGPEAQKALERLVHDESGLVQVEAVKALHQLQTLAANFTLRETYAQTDDHLVRRAVVESHVPVGKTPTPPIQDSNALIGESRLLVSENVARETLSTALATQTDPHTRAWVIYSTMLEVGKAIVPSLRDLWQTETEPVVRQMLVDLLVSLGEAEERQLLLNSLIREPAIQVRRDIIRVFVKWRGNEVRRVFLAALPAELDENLQVTLIQALAYWKDRDVIRAIHAQQKSTGSSRVRQAAQQSIHGIFDRMPFDEYGAYLTHEPEAGIRLEIIKILGYRCRSFPVVNRIREMLVTALRTEQDPIVAAELLEAVAVWSDDEEIRELVYEWLRGGKRIYGVPTALRILSGHYPEQEITALAKPYFDSLPIRG